MKSNQSDDPTVVIKRGAPMSKWKKVVAAGLGLAGLGGVAGALGWFTGVLGGPLGEKSPGVITLEDNGRSTTGDLDRPDEGFGTPTPSTSSTPSKARPTPSASSIAPTPSATNSAPGTNQNPAPGTNQGKSTPPQQAAPAPKPSTTTKITTVEHSGWTGTYGDTQVQNGSTSIKAHSAAKSQSGGELHFDVQAGDSTTINFRYKGNGDVDNRIYVNGKELIQFQAGVMYVNGQSRGKGFTDDIPNSITTKDGEIIKINDQQLTNPIRFAAANSTSMTIKVNSKSLTAEAKGTLTVSSVKTQRQEIVPIGAAKGAGDFGKELPVGSNGSFVIDPQTGHLALQPKGQAIEGIA